MATDDEKIISGKLLRESIEEYFDIDDYRRHGSVRHNLADILFITIYAVISGADSLKAVAQYAKSKSNWLEQVLDISQGVPSYTTLWTVFALLNPEALGRSFVDWVQTQVKLDQGSVVCIDGKAQRGTAKPGQPHSFVNIVSAWAADHQLTLAQLKVDGKSNEITAIPELIDMLDLKGTTVTIDAAGCQTAIAEKIVNAGADYVLALKGNQGSLVDEVENYFTQAQAANFEGIKYDAVGSKEEGHGRIEKREIYVTEEIDWLPQKRKWKNLTSIAMVITERSVPGQAPSIEKRYYISSRGACASTMKRAIRMHWGIENQVHWILDVAMKEDDQKANAGHISENMSLLRRVALNMLKQEKTAKCGVETKRKMAGWNNDYLLKVIGVKYSS